jgi:hypothetical protein
MKSLNCTGTSAEIGRRLKVNATKSPTSPSRLDLLCRELSDPLVPDPIRDGGACHRPRCDRFLGVGYGLNGLYRPGGKMSGAAMRGSELSRHGQEGRETLPRHPAGFADSTSRRTAAPSAALSRGRYR